MAQITIVANGYEGHRREYIALFTALFASHNISSEVRSLKLRDVLTSGALFSPMLEEHSISFMAIAAARSLIGRRSVALLFRPTETISSNSPRHRVKRLALKLLLRLPHNSIITILPFEVDPSFASVARSWIYDPQLWDLAPDEDTPETAITSDIRTLAGGRDVVVALGGQTYEKGFDYMVDVWTTSNELRKNTLFVAAGKVSENSSESASQFSKSGGALINRFISDEELIELYKVSDTIWACYAPSYDQASGIFGRAVQFSVPVIVRDGSQVSKLSRFLNHSTTTITWGDPDAAAHQIISEFQKRGSEADIGTNTASLRGHSLSTLGKALGLNISDEDFNSDIRSKDGT